ncbi:MAG: hypothetical protein QME21_07565 [Anaerolineales bacterium]|nr:hypothetical protein [Anaerolineales bacterium]
MNEEANSVVQMQPAENSESMTYRRTVKSSPAMLLLPALGVILWLPSIIGLVNTLSGASRPPDFGVSMCNFGLAILGGILIMVYLTARGANKIAQGLLLSVDETGIAESGYPKPEQNWRLDWVQISDARLVGKGDNRILRLYTPESPDKPARLLAGYPFDELMDTFNMHLGLLGKQVQFE